MNKTKYIVGRLSGSGVIGCLVFSEFINHSDMVDNFTKILGAGFLFIENGEDKPEVRAYGESLSLGVKSREEDTVIIKKALGLLY